MISKQLSESVRSLFAGFYQMPGTVWERWVEVPDSTGQDMIALLGSFIERGLRGERSTPLRAYRAYEELGKLATMAPWNELMSINNEGKSIDLINSVGDDELNELCRIIAEESTAIETIEELT